MAASNDAWDVFAAKMEFRRGSAAESNEATEGIVAAFGVKVKADLDDFATGDEDIYLLCRE